MKKVLGLILAGFLYASVYASITIPRSTDSWCVGSDGYEVCVDSSGNLIATTDDNQDLGTSTYEWQDGYFDGTIYADAISLTGSITQTGGLNITGDSDLDGALTVNESSADVNTRIEGNGDANLFFVDAGTDRVGIGTATPAVLFDVDGVINATQMTINEAGADLDSRIEGDTDANLLYTDAGNDRVGVGTGTPATLLDVDGVLSATSFIMNEVGGDLDSRIEGDTDANLFYTNAGDDRVGIGTNAPATLLDVDGVFSSTSFIINEVGADLDSRIEGDTDANLFYTDGGNDRVGLGTATPATKLDVQGNITANAADPAVILDGSTASDTDFWIGLTADEGGDDNDLFQIGDGTTAGSNVHLTITTDGDVGLGQVTPSAKIDAVESLAAATGNEIAYELNYTTNKASSGNDTGLFIGMTNTASPGTSLPLDIQVDAGTVFSVNEAGNTTVAGTLGVTSTSTLAATDIVGTTTIQGAVTVNESGADVDFRVEGDTNANMLVVDAGDDTVSIGGGTGVKEILTATAALDFPSITTLIDADLTIAVTGAAVGDACHLGLPAAPEGNIAFNCFVSATDTVTVRAHNYTAGSLDPASATYRVVTFGY